MRSHSEILRSLPQLAPFAQRRGVSVHTARSWIQRNRIPSEHWKALADEKIASLEELAEGVAASTSDDRCVQDTHDKWANFPFIKRSGGKTVTSEDIYRLLDELD